MRSLLRALTIVLIMGIAGALALFFIIMSRGISARAEPGWFETRIARTMRSLAVPRPERDQRNPTPYSPEVFAAAKAHWADHCASCHANDGSGNTTLGRGMYPKAPDMRLAETQSLTDGELFFIIENGIRLTGMPAWGNGTPEGAAASWELVHFIRQLPKLTPQDLEEMEELNPRSLQQLREEEEMRRFLEGGEKGKKPPKPRAPHKHGGG